MGVKPGYKRTEVGVIPEEWECLPIADLAAPVANAIVGGPFGSDLVSADYVHDGVPVIRGQNMGARYLEGPFAYVTEAKANSLAANLARPGDVVFTQRGTLGQVSITPSEPFDRYLISQSQMKVTVHRDRVTPAFLFSWFESNEGQQSIASSAIQTGVPHINLGILKALTVPVPPEPEQRAIATALSDVDALLTKLDRLIAKKRDVKQATMQQLLTGKTRLPGCSGEWLSVKAGEIGRFRGGSGFPTKFQGNGTGTLPFYKVSDMNTPGNEVFMSHANNYIGSEIRAKLSATVFPPMTIVFAKVGAAIFLERKKLLRFASCLDNNMAGYVPEPGITDPRYLHYVFMSTALSDLVSTTALPSLNNRVLASMILRLPPIEEQTAIATLLSDLDAELAALEARRDKTRALKQGMMQELLTGRTRLV